MLAPKGFTQTVSKDTYIAAQCLANKRVGVLKWTTPLTVLSVALALLGGNLLLESGGRAGYLLTGIALLCVAAVIAVLWWGQFPAVVKKQAEADFITFDALSNGAAVTFTADEMMLKTERLSRRVEYAKTRVCAEAPSMFVILTDDDAVVILQKDAFADRENTEAFLRDVFARWYKKVK